MRVAAGACHSGARRGCFASAATRSISSAMIGATGRSSPRGRTNDSMNRRLLAAPTSGCASASDICRQCSARSAATSTSPPLRASR